MKEYSIRVTIEAKNEDELWNKINNSDIITNVCGIPIEIHKFKEGYCSKCNELIEDMNELEQQEAEENNGTFVCSTCINKEMEEEKT